MLMQNIVLKINYDHLNKNKTLKKFVKRNMHEIEIHVIYFYYKQHLHQHAKHK